MSDEDNSELQDLAGITGGLALILSFPLATPCARV